MKLLRGFSKWCFFIPLLAIVNLELLAGQTNTTSAIAGTITDSSGAVLTTADVVAMDVGTGARREAKSNPDGRFVFAQLQPGTWLVTATAPGFARQQSQPFVVEVGRTVTLNLRLALSAGSQTVEVRADEGLLSLDNPNTTTTLDAKTIERLPNPGQDLTFVAQFAPGALMNTAGSSNDAKAAGGYGNVEFNGLPATSNGYILDGFDSNDPWLGLNIGLSSNLVIGLDAVEQATVNTNSYSVDQGRYGASQVNYFTKSGTNLWHGDLYEVWNGSPFNAENYFLHANDTPGDVPKKPRSVVNEFGGSVGGPIRRDKFFFFLHLEGIRIALPIVRQLVAPSPAYQQYVLSQLAQGGIDPLTGIAMPPEPLEVPLYRKMFGLYRNTAGSPVAVNSCPLDANGAPIAGPLPNGSGCADQRQESLGNTDSENLIVLKIDQAIGANDHLWYRFQQDTGLQAAYTDAVNPMFNSYSPQPQRTLVLGYTHVFHSNLVNQFNPGASWYSSIFQPNNYSQVQQTFPIVLQAGGNNAPFTVIGGNDNTYPQGRKVTQWQINDNLDWTRGKHTNRFGIDTRRVDVSDYDLGEGTVPMAVYNDLAQFTYGAAYTESWTFPVARKERISQGNLELYVMDTWKPVAGATFTAGLRTTWNTDPVNQQRLFARPEGSFLDMPHDMDQPLDKVIRTGVRNLFPATPVLLWQPRVSAAYQVARGTVVHAGFGVFSDIIPAQVSDLAATNAPNAPTFVGGIGGQVGGVAIFPGVPGSAADAALKASRQFRAAFGAGAAPCPDLAADVEVCPMAVSLNTFRGRLKTPDYYQYNLGIELQLGGQGAARLDYVGTRGVHEPYQVELNGYQTVCAECFAPYPYASPLDPRFGSVNEFRTDAVSNYAGLQASTNWQSHGLTLRGNYTLSHCLDEVSNGGLLSFSSQGILSPLPGALKRQYGNCDYDVRHNVSAFGMYQIPFASPRAQLRALISGWSFSETAFVHSGLPFTVLSQPYTAAGKGVFQASGPQFARRTPGVQVYRKSAYPGVTAPGTRQWLNPEAFASVVDPTTGGAPEGTA